MKDPHIHVEKGWIYTGFGQMRELISNAIGLVPSAPKTVGTGCGRRRPYAMTSVDPLCVTCLGCLTYAVEALDAHLALTMTALTIPQVSEDSKRKIQQEHDESEAMVALFRARLPLD